MHLCIEYDSVIYVSTLGGCEYKLHNIYIVYKYADIL